MSKNSKISSLDTKDLGRKSMRSGMINMVAQGISVVLQLSSTIILARLLTPDAYGLIGMVMAVVAFAGMFRDLGLSTATIQRKELSDAQVSVLFWVNVVMGLGLTLALALSSPLVVWFYDRPELKWITVVLGFNIFISSMGAQHAALLTRNMQFKKLSIASITSALANFTVALIGAVYGLEHWALALGAVAASFSNTLLVWIFSGWIPGLPKRNTGSREMIKYGLNLTGFEFVNYFSRNLDNILIGKVIGSVVLGYYTRAYRLITFPISSIRTPLASVALPGLSSLQGEADRFRSYYTQLLSVLSLVTMPIATFTYIAADPIVRVVLGDQWMQVVPIMQWLAIAAFLQPVSGLFGVVLIALGHARKHLHCGLISALVLSVVFLISVHWGVEALAMSYAASGYVLFIPIFLYASKNTGIDLKDFFNGVWRGIMASAVAAVSFVLFDISVLVQNSLAELLLMGLQFALFYILCIVILPGGRQELGQLFTRFRQAILKKKLIKDPGMTLKEASPMILLTNIHERSALGALRSFNSKGINVARSTTTKGLRLLDNKEKIEIHPSPDSEFVDFKNWLQERLKRDKNLLILPINEAVVFACDTLRSEQSEFAERFIMPSSASLNYSLSKFKATKAAQKASIDTPETFFIKNPFVDKINIPDEPLEYPLILKWDNVLKESGEYEKGSLKVVNNRTELKDAIAELAPSGCGMILQKMIPGYGVGAFFLRQNGKVILRFAHRRLHEVPWTGGVSAYCESSDDEEVLKAGESLLESINYEGLAMVEFRKEKGKPPIFLEINGRLWGSLGLALKAGADFPTAMVEYHLENKTSVKQPSLKKKVRWHEPAFDMLYLRSLWSENSRLKTEKAPIFKGAVRVGINFFNPLVGSDWMRFTEPFQTGKRYLRLLKNQASQTKRELLKNRDKQEDSALVQEAIKRTPLLLNNLPNTQKILFVCYGNICRSPYTELRWESMRQADPELPEATSVGFHNKTGRATPARFQSVARNLGVDLSGHRSRRITPALVDDADIIIIMDYRNLTEMQREFPYALNKTLLLGAVSKTKNVEIPDPYGQKIGMGGLIYRRLDEELNIFRKSIKKGSFNFLSISNENPSI